MVASEVARRAAKLGNAKVESDGGLRSPKPDVRPALGPAGSDGFLEPIVSFGGAKVLALLFAVFPSSASDAKAD